MTFDEIARVFNSNKSIFGSTLNIKKINILVYRWCNLYADKIDSSRKKWF